MAEAIRRTGTKIGEEIAKSAYLAYGKVTDFKNFRGEPMPEFEALPEKIRLAWMEAVRQVWLGFWKDHTEFPLQVLELDGNFYEVRKMQPKL
jgi:hypothetical protein